MAHFYLAESIADAAVGDTVTVTGAEARHAVTVSRLAVGERVLVGNGRGLVVEGTVTAAAPTEFSVVAEVAATVEREKPALVLVQALAKGDRDELAVQAATELGVDAVIPWSAQRSISRWEGAKVRKGIDRWTAITREATKQSIRPWIPDVAELATTKGVAALCGDFQVLVLQPDASTPFGEVVSDGRDIVLVVGPEGGIAPAELELLAAAGAQIVRIGNTVLRTSTAGPAAIAALNTRLGRW